MPGFAGFRPESAYAAAGTVIRIMLWVSYAGLIVLFGAEFTRTYAEAHGRHVEPADGAMSTELAEGGGKDIVQKKATSRR